MVHFTRLSPMLNNYAQSTVLDFSIYLAVIFLLNYLYHTLVVMIELLL